jgi:bacterioferritin-associated ferredoxin
MIICICNGISDKSIQKAARGGCNDFVELMEMLGLADECGTCFDDAYRMFEDALENS